MRKNLTFNLIVITILTFIIVIKIGCSQKVQKADFQSEWAKDIEQIWVGPEYWANRLQDWQVANGRLECVEGSSRKPMRTVHLLTRKLSTKRGSLRMSVLTGLIDKSDEVTPDAQTGFLIGAGNGMDYRAAALIHHSYGSGAGLFAGINSAGSLFIRDFANNELIQRQEGTGVFKSVQLEMLVEPSGIKYTLVLKAINPETGEILRSLKLDSVEPERLVSNLALVSHPGSNENNNRFWFQNWKVAGSKIEVHAERHCGPVLSTQYTLSQNVLKMTAQMMPIGKMDSQSVTLEIQKDGIWKLAATTKIIVPGYTALFCIKNWDSSRDTPYRVICNLHKSNSSTKEYIWSGKIRRDPVDKEEIVVAAFTGNHNIGRHGWRGADSGEFPWTDRMWFPHKDLTERVAKHRPDVLFFSGDQVYEGASPTVAQKSPLEKAYLDYLYKWYLWCWAFRDMTKDIPCVTIPDDHDVYQGNLWGAGGRKIDRDNRGGYIMPPDWVNMVQRTQTSHLPDPYDPTPIEQGIKVYYCDMNYGRISFAVIEDRKFKSGPAGLAPATKSGRPDHVIDPYFNPNTADVPGAKLLGERQLKFLEDWAGDWRKTDMKVVLSQTVFANATSLHGAEQKRLVVDYDSNGWPQTARNKALQIFRKAFATHISGDQHLATIIHYGIENWNDAGWSLCVPSIANFYPRTWLPLKPGRNQKEGMPNYTGEFLDGLGNHITVWAAANPGKSTGKQPAALHDSMPGYGIVRFNKKERTITMECWPRYVNPSYSKTGGQYPGWPKTVKLEDNYGQKAVAYLPNLKISGIADPVVQVISEADNEVVYTLRIKGASFRPKVFKEGMYTIKIGEPGTTKMKTLQGIRSIKPDKRIKLEVKF